LTTKKAKDAKKSKAYAWAAYMWQRHPDEMKKLLKYGTPSDDLIKLAESKFEYTVRGKTKFWSFPESLHKSAGQKLLFNAVKNVKLFVQSIPVLAFASYQELTSQLKLRRADTTENALLVAEAILYRAATEFKAEVLFSFDSINTWIKAKTGKTLGYVTIRKALELLESKFYLTVREWGTRGNRRKATKIYVHLDPKLATPEIAAGCDEWIISHANCMNAVYARESIARQDVLEANIHNYADSLISEDPSILDDGPAWAPVRRLFTTSDDTMEHAGTSSAPMTLEELLHEIQIDRHLGELVQPLYSNGSSIRASSDPIRQPRAG
jgi:hypothetical protein